jgi:transcription elongation GreA/GreB family factor
MQKKIKTQLYNYCSDYAETRIINAKNAMEAAQNSANSETKSTAGDKHDTARAMMQLEVEQQAKLLAESNKFKQALAQFGPESGNGTIALGSLVKTNSGSYYISISVGKIDMDGEIYFAISPISPVGKAMLGLSQGDEYEFNNKSFIIESVF